jgi:CHAD domain
MARPRPVPGIAPAKSLRRNARRVLAVRIEEVYGYEGDVADPARVRELHDMRIACKRLRYLLEIFDPAFLEDLEPFVDEVKDLQDLLGDIHDCDVQIPMLEEHLAWLEEREAAAAQELVARGGGRRRRGRTPAKGAGEAGQEAAFRRFEAKLARLRRGDERLGVHALIGRRRRERDELYARFLDTWRRLKAERFRPRLEEALGL